MTKRHGKCLCGSVKFSIEKEKSDISACHCAMCRTWSGGPFMGLHPKGETDFEGTEHIGQKGVFAKNAEVTFSIEQKNTVIHLAQAYLKTKKVLN